MSGITVGTAIAISAGIGGATSIAGGIMGSMAAGQQADAAMNAAQLQYKASEDALAFQKEQWQKEQENLAPWLQTGKQGLTQLSQLLGIGKDQGTAGYGSLLTPWTEQFQAPTDVTEQNDPGYQFRLKQGMDALQNSAAAKGGLLTSGTAKNLTNYAQDYASNEYNNVYGRSMQEYLNKYNIFKQNQSDIYNRLAGISGTGQTAANTLGQLGQSTAGNVTNILGNMGSQVGQSLIDAGTARASGYGNWGNTISGLGSNLTQLFLLDALNNQRQSAPQGTWV